MDKIYVCYSSSDEYAEYTGVSLLSLLDNGNGQYISKIFMLDYGIKDVNRRKIQSIVDNFGLAIEYINALDILNSLQKQLDIKNFRSSLATYSRAFIDCILPSYVDKVLYIDSDTVINGSISELLNERYSEKAISGAVCLELYDGLHTVKEFPLLTGNKIYIGCGIVLYNLEIWRREGCQEKIKETCARLRNPRFADQTVINNAIPEQWIGILPPKFNYSGHAESKPSEKITLKAGGWYSRSEIDEAMNDPVIIHFKGGALVRPWYEGCASRMGHLYEYYKHKSPWSESPLIPLEIAYSKMSKSERIDYKYSKIAIKCRFRLFERMVYFMARVEKIFSK